MLVVTEVVIFFLQFESAITKSVQQHFVGWVYLLEKFGDTPV